MDVIVSSEVSNLLGFSDYVTITAGDYEIMKDSVSGWNIVEVEVY